MKNKRMALTILFMCIMLAVFCSSAAADVAVDENNFPDPIFLRSVKGYDKNGDGALSDEELSSVKGLYFYEDYTQNCLMDLKGIEFFTELEELSCGGNQITNLDLGSNTALKYLYCGGNQIKSLDLSKNIKLVTLACDGAQLSSLDVSNNPMLEELYCSGNQLISLNLSNNPLLEKIHCNNNQLQSLDISTCDQIREVYCYDNHLKNIIFGQNKALERIDCYGNRFTELDVSNCPKLVEMIKKGNRVGISKLEKVYNDEVEINGDPYVTYLAGTYSKTPKKIIPIRSLTLKTTATTMRIIEEEQRPTQQLSVDIQPENASFKYLKWESSDPDILTVDENGLVTALKKGKATVSVTTEDGSEITAKAQIIVAYPNELTIDEINFPDDVFREMVSGFDSDQDSVLSEKEKNAVTKIDIEYGNNIVSMKGIEHFPALTYLNFYQGSVEELDVSKNTALTFLNCSCNYLTDLDISKNTALIHLNCSGNDLRKLDVSKNTELTYLECGLALLEELDVSHNTKLETLRCYNNKLKKLDISRNTGLKDLLCQLNQIRILDISKNTKLERVICNYNQLKNIDLSHNPALSILYCSKNQLKDLDLSNNPLIFSLFCYGNNIKTLDLTKNPILCQLVHRIDSVEKEFDGFQVLAWEAPHDTRPDGAYELYADPDIKLLTGDPKSTDISGAGIKAIKDQVYTGKTIEPAVKVTYFGKTLQNGTDYTISFSNNKEIGTAKVTITGKGEYSGSKSSEFRIVPKPVKIKSLAFKDGKLIVQWTKGSHITGYQIEYSLKKDFSDSTIKTVSKAGTTKVILKNLTAGKTYFVRIRTYQKKNGEKYYSTWSKVSTCKGGIR